MTNSISCVEEADCILVTGSNTTENHPLIGTRVITAAKKGTKLIVADNRKIRLAESADMHIRHENGSDAAFLNGLMHVIIKEGLADDEYVKTRTENFDELKATVEEFTPERVAAICKITPEEVVNAARMYATAERAMIIYSMGITQHSHGVDNVKSCANLAMLTGNVGKAGTGVNPLRGQNNVQGACDMGALPNVYSGYQKVVDEASRAKFEKAWGVENLPGAVGLTVTTAINAAFDGDLKALFVLGENPMMSDPDQHHVKAGLEKLDFLVVQDIFPTPTTALADVVLPAACYAEKDGTFTSTERRCQRVRKACDPPGKARQDWDIVGDLARRMGYDGLTYNSPKEIMDEITEVTPIYGGMHYDRIDQVGLQWPCPNRDHPGTPFLHKGTFKRGLGLFGPASYKPSMELPDDVYPFLLSTGRCYFHFHSGTMTRRTRLLDREERFPYIEIHPDDAKRLGIYDRFPVMVSTRRGEVKALARVSDIVIPGHLFMTFHFEEGAANVLTNNALDPVAKIPEFKVCAAQIKGAS